MITFGLPVMRVASARSAAREGAEVVAVAALDLPAEARELRLEVAEVADRAHPGVGLDLVVVDDDGDLADAVVGGGDAATPRSALPAVRRRRSARRCGRSCRRAGSARTMPLAFEMPMPSEPVLVTMPGCRRRDGRAGRRSRRSSCSLSNGSTPERRSAPNRAPGASWPLEEKIARSSGPCELVSQIAASSRCRGSRSSMPMWPDPARAIM